MAYQSNFNGLVAYKAQSALGTPASGASASVLRVAGGNGIKLAKAAIESNEIRADGMRSRGRHGSQRTSSAYLAELSLGSHDPILEAIMRGTWDAVALTKTQADFTSLTTAVDGIIFASGNPITMGYRVGDVIRAAGLPDASNNARNLRIAALSSTKITTAETLVANAVADTTCSITRVGKRLVNPTVPIKRYFTVEEYEGDIDQSTTMQDFVWGSAKIALAPNGLVHIDPGGIGTGQISGLSTAASPYFTSPVANTNVPMSCIDATIRINGIDQVALTSFDLTVDLNPATPDVVGSKFGPDVFTGQMAVSLNLSMLRTDLQLFQDFVAETVYSLHLLCVDNTAEPKDFLAVTVPNFTMGGVDPSAFSKQGGGRTQTVSVPAALVGKDTSTTGDGSMIKFQTTAP